MFQSLLSAPNAMRLPTIHEISDAEFAAIRAMIFREAGISLSESKRALVCSRLAKRLRELNLPDHAAYLRYLESRDSTGAERQEMINCLTTNKTDFFREPHHFAFLREVVFPELVERSMRGGPRRLRIWSAACSMGDEPYSIAMEAKEFPGFARGWDIGILASDISTRVLRIAEAGIYPMERIDPVAGERRGKYFLRGTGRLAGMCQVRPELKRLITFRQLNLVGGALPIQTTFDVIFCRNVIIYFNQSTQEKVLRRLAERIHPGGHLMLGHSESPHWLTEVLSPLGQTIYQKPHDGRCVAGGGQGNSPVFIDTKTRTAPPSWLPKPKSKLHESRPSHKPAASRGPVAAKGTVPVLLTQKSGPSPRHVPPQPMPIRPLPRKSIVAGETCVSRDAVEICTLLGSCVAACLYDPVTRIGGMNHFMLPGHELTPGESARYGIYAMELLINGIMKLGGDRRRLQAKVFGGANVLGMPDPTVNVGLLNIEFIRRFLKTDGIPIVAERLGGKQPVRVHFHTATAKAFVRALGATRELAEIELMFEKRVASQLTHPVPEAVTLF